jgi:hypothetical protein
LAVALVQL